MKVRFSSGARHYIAREAVYLRERSSTGAARFHGLVARARRQIETFPESGCRLRRSGRREMIVPGRTQGVRVVLLLWFTLFTTFWPLASHAAEEEEAIDDLRQSCTAFSGEEVCIAETTYTADVCTAISTFAARWRLPEAYFARLIWQESRFDPLALSPAGAQGIAQFMPGTARIRGLGNAFHPAEALARSAEYLRFLTDKFGNLGLAAAAYNGGERRIENLLAHGTGLARETRDYVVIVTGRSVGHWLAERPEPVDFTLVPEVAFQTACLDMARSVRRPDLTTDPGDWQPWGVLIAQTNSATTARDKFEAVQARFGEVIGTEKLMLITVRNPNFGRRLRFSAMLGRQTRAEAQELCQKLTAAGAACIVQKTQP